MKIHCTNVIGPFDRGDYAFSYAGVHAISIHWKCGCGAVNHIRLAETDWNGKVSEMLIRLTARCNACRYTFRFADGSIIDARQAA